MYEVYIVNEVYYLKLFKYEGFWCKVVEIYDVVNDVEWFIDIYGLCNVNFVKLYFDLYLNIEFFCNSLREFVEFKK